MSRVSVAARRIDCDGVGLHVELEGPDDAPTVRFLHGVGSSGRTWEGLRTSSREAGGSSGSTFVVTDGRLSSTRRLWEPTTFASPMATRKLRLRYPATCSSCGLALSRGTEAVWDSQAKTATCLACAPGELRLRARRGRCVGGSRRRAPKQRQVEAVRREHGDHAAAVAEAVASTSWEKGSDGEFRLAEFIQREVGDHVISLHDRLIPGTRGNIDHLWITPTGVWIVDSKSYKGKVVKRDVGPFWRTESKVYVGGRDRTKLATAMQLQLDAVLAALRSDPAAKETDVHAALCFVDSDWGLLDFPFQVGSVWVLYPGALRKRLKKSGSALPRADGTPREAPRAIAASSRVVTGQPGKGEPGSSRKTSARPARILQCGHVRKSELRSDRPCRQPLPATPTRAPTSSGERYLATYGGDEIPVPVESIAEDLLGLRIEEDDLGECSGMLIPAERLIVVNASEAMSGDTPTRRHRFTIAHELGHWICHATRHAETAPTYCRSQDMSQDTDRALEREANVFGAELLMPEAAVREAWEALDPTRAGGVRCGRTRKNRRGVVRRVDECNVVPALQLRARPDQAGRGRRRLMPKHVDANGAERWTRIVYVIALDDKACSDQRRSAAAVGRSRSTSARHASRQRSASSSTSMVTRLRGGSSSTARGSRRDIRRRCPNSRPLTSRRGPSAFSRAS